MRKKKKSSIDIEQAAASQSEGIMPVRKFLGESSEEDAFAFGELDAPTDIASMKRKPWDPPEEDADLEKSRRPDGTKTGWDREGQDESESVTESEPDEQVQKQSARTHADTDADGDVAAPVGAEGQHVEEEMALAGVEWDEALGDWTPRQSISAMVDALPYYRALRKSITAQDNRKAARLMSNLVAMEYSSTEAIPYSLVKLVRRILLKPEPWMEAKELEERGRRKKRRRKGEREGEGGGAGEGEGGEEGERKREGEGGLPDMARTLLGRWLKVAQHKEEPDDKEDEDNPSYRDPTRRALEGAEDTDYLLGGTVRPQVLTKQEIRAQAEQLHQLFAGESWPEASAVLAEPLLAALPWDQVDPFLLRIVKRLRRCGDSEVEAQAASLVQRWKEEVQHSAAAEALLQQRIREAERGERERGPLGPGLAFDRDGCLPRCIELRNKGRMATRSDRGNAKVSCLALFGHAAHKPASNAKGSTGVSTWAVRVDKCSGGSMHIGCVTPIRNNPDDAALEDPEEGWGVLGVVGEAFNYRAPGYLVGSAGLVWECGRKGPRSLTSIVKDEIGDNQASEPLTMTDGAATSSVEPSVALRFISAGSTVIMSLDRRKKELSFTVNQAPTFALTGVPDGLRPVVVLKAVGDTVSVIDPLSVS